MLWGLIHHETDMEIYSNIVDSRGQSEIAFAFCHILGIDLLPRLRRMHEQRLYLPDRDCLATYNLLKPVLAKNPFLNWDLATSQYDEMLKYVTAVQNKPEAVTSILRRFSSYNANHPTYKAFKVIGKAKKTIFVARFLLDSALQREMLIGKNVIESWNGMTDFIHYGQKSAFVSNNPERQETMLLSLQLLQNAVILANTLMLNELLIKPEWKARLTSEDYRSLKPSFTGNINPYGVFKLIFDKPPLFGGF